MTRAISNKDAFSNKDSAIIKCDCGEEILLIPDLEEMGKAIEIHAEKHQQKISDPTKAQAEAERVKNLLIVQVLLKAGK